jgi:hypothetical protein
MLHDKFKENYYFLGGKINVTVSKTKTDVKQKLLVLETWDLNFYI